MNNYWTSPATKNLNALIAASTKIAVTVVEKLVWTPWMRARPLQLFFASYDLVDDILQRIVINAIPENEWNLEYMYVVITEPNVVALEKTR